MITCPCGGKTYVKDTRPLDDGIWRRRACKECARLTTTFEQACATEVQPKGVRKGGLAPVRRKITAPSKVTITKPLRSQPPGPRVADPTLASARNRMEDARAQRELEGEY